MVRATHNQNLLLADVKQSDLYRTRGTSSSGSALRCRTSARSPDMIACPGLDFCSLANAGTLNVAASIQSSSTISTISTISATSRWKMSGCMNACGHHHVGHIGILGVDKHGEEWYQITLGGSVNGFTSRSVT